MKYTATVTFDVLDFEADSVKDADSKIDKLIDLLSDASEAWDSLNWDNVEWKAEVTTMNKTPLVGKQVTIVCDEATLQELYKLNDYQWDNFNEGEFMFFIGEVGDTELNDEQMEFYGNN